MAERFLLIEECDFCSYPTGGQLTFAKQMLQQFGQQLALVGITTDSQPVGKWTKRIIDGKEYDYFALFRKEVTSRKEVIPARLRGYLSLLRHKNGILSLGLRNAFVQGQHTLKAVHSWNWDGLCYRFPGVSNPLSISKYCWARPLARPFDKWFFPALQSVDLTLAAADQNAIDGLLQRAKGLIRKDQIKPFPTRVDTTIFSPGNSDTRRTKFDFAPNCRIIVTSGRLHWAKGWSLLLESFCKYHFGDPNSKLVFVGDGPDHQRIRAKARELGIGDHVFITGHQEPVIVAEYLRAADIFVLGSETEGWSTSLVEALACGKPIVTTDVSSANEIVKNGINGFVVSHRDPRLFSEAMKKALRLDAISTFRKAELPKYAVSNLATDLSQYWHILQ